MNEIETITYTRKPSQLVIKFKSGRLRGYIGKLALIIYKKLVEYDRAD